MIVNRHLNNNKELKLYEYIELKFLNTSSIIYKEQSNRRYIAEKHGSEYYLKATIDIENSMYKIECIEEFFDAVLIDIIIEFESIQYRKDTKSILANVYKVNKELNIKVKLKNISNKSDYRIESFQ